MTDAPPDVLADALVDLFPAGAALTLNEVEQELDRRGLRLGEDPEADLHEAMDDSSDVVLMPTNDGRYVALPALARDVLLTHRLGQVRTQGAQLLAPDAAPRPSTPPRGQDDLALREALGQVMKQHEVAWVDESIPARSGATPHEVTADPTRRSDLVRLLDGYPHVDPDDHAQMSAARLRVALGLPARPR